MRSNEAIPTGAQTSLEPCFIFGITPRSGTNYLFRLLNLHPRCVAAGPIWEDFLTHHSDLLIRYAEALYQRWGPWEVDQRIGPPDVLLSCIGDALIRFLNLQVAHKLAAGEPGDPARERLLHSNPEYLLTKTPSVGGLQHFSRLFPHARMIIIIRDGRAVVESGVRSFGWRYERAMRNWAEAARVIARLDQHSSTAEVRHLIVRYEDLFADAEGELRKILSFLALDSSEFDFRAAASLTTTGSSECRQRGNGKMHWRPVEKTPEFQPQNRWASWNRARHERFNWIAKDCLSRFGYTPMFDDRRSFFHIARNVLMDLVWGVLRLARRIR